jgi:diaminopimelate epimerase
MTRVAIPFTKMVGAGNDFVIVDTVHHPLPALKGRWRAVSRAVCDRHRGVGADGLLVLEPSSRADVRMRVFNPDGTEAEMCGNGARCVARFLQDSSPAVHRRSLRRRLTYRADRGPRAHVCIETAGGLFSAQVEQDRVRMWMPDPSPLELDLTLEADGTSWRAAAVQTGVPHLVVPVTDLDAVDVERVGRMLRHHRHFRPQGTNVDFLQADPRRPNRLRIRTYERGVEAETLACGTGVTACAVVQALAGDLRLGTLAPNDRDPARQCRFAVETASGETMIVLCTVVADGGAQRVTDVVLEGPATRVFEGLLHWSAGRG